MSKLNIVLKRLRVSRGDKSSTEVSMTAYNIQTELCGSTEGQTGQFLGEGSELASWRRMGTDPFFLEGVIGTIRKMDLGAPAKCIVMATVHSGAR